MWMTQKLAGKKQNIDATWKLLHKEVDLGEPTSVLDHVFLGCTQRQCEISKDIVDNCRTMFESRISAGWTENLPFSENLRISSWSYDMEGHAKQCVERYCELANKTTQQPYKVSTPSIDDHHFKKEELKSVGELSQVCSQIGLKCWNLARIGRPDILWSVNKLGSTWECSWKHALCQRSGIESNELLTNYLQNRVQRSEAQSYFKLNKMVTNQLDQKTREHVA